MSLIKKVSLRMDGINVTSCACMIIFPSFPPRFISHIYRYHFWSTMQQQSSLWSDYGGFFCFVVYPQECGFFFLENKGLFSIS